MVVYILYPAIRNPRAVIIQSFAVWISTNQTLCDILALLNIDRLTPQKNRPADLHQPAEPVVCLEGISVPRQYPTDLIMFLYFVSVVFVYHLSRHYQ